MEFQPVFFQVYRQQRSLHSESFISNDVHRLVFSTRILYRKIIFDDDANKTSDDCMTNTYPRVRVHTVRALIYLCMYIIHTSITRAYE